MGGIELRAGGWHALIDAQLGGSVLQLSHAGEPVLRPTMPEELRRSGVRASACYPLVPFANRIGYGRMRVAGKDYLLHANFPPEPHAIHGIGWQRSWHVSMQAPSMAELMLSYGGDSPHEWPFAFDARQRFELTRGGLQIMLTLVNRDSTAWPAGIGLHPYLPACPGQTLQFESDGAWRNRPDRLPGAYVAGSEWDFSAPKLAGQLDLDHDFRQWRGWVRIGGGSAGTVRIAATDTFPVLRVFTPPGRGFLAVEPVSHAADAVNRAWEEGAGYRLLAPGEALTGRVSIELEGRA